MIVFNVARSAQSLATCTCFLFLLLLPLVIAPFVIPAQAGIGSLKPVTQSMYLVR